MWYGLYSNHKTNTLKVTDNNITFFSEFVSSSFFFILLCSGSDKLFLSGTFHCDKDTQL